MIEQQKFIEQHLYNYVDILDESMCNRCMFNRYHSKKWTNHNQGKLYIELANNYNITEDKVHRWMFDSEHGLLHCFLVGFFAYIHIITTTDYTHSKLMMLIRKGTFEENWFEKLLISCLLHDFARCDGEENHDHNLRRYYPNLAHEVYTHTNPPENETVSSLVVGDRIELRRFYDWKHWVNVDIFSYTNTYQEEVNWFYQHMRPALQQLFDNRYGLWVSHGTETRTDFKKGVYPQGVEWELRRQHINLYSVEVGKLFTFTALDADITNCMLDHTKRWSPNGLIPLSTLKRYNFQLIPCRTYSGRDQNLDGGLIKGRDHLGIMDLCLPVNEWTFLYDYENIEKSRFAPLEEVIQHAHGLEDKLIMRILNTTEKFVERMMMVMR